MRLAPHEITHATVRGLQSLLQLGVFGFELHDALAVTHQIRRELQLRLIRLSRQRAPAPRGKLGRERRQNLAQFLKRLDLRPLFVRHRAPPSGLRVRG
jgi:hypothetical protein